MGSKYRNLTLRGAEQTEVRRTLAAMGRTGAVCPTVDGFTVVYERTPKPGEAARPELAAELSRGLACVAWDVLNFDDDVLWYQLYRNGERVDKYLSNPAYGLEDFLKQGATYEQALRSGLDPDFITEEMWARREPPTGPGGGSAAVLCAALGVPHAEEQVCEILRRPLRHYVFELNRHGELAGALGLPDFVAGFDYENMVEGDLPEELEPDMLLWTGG